VLSLFSAIALLLAMIGIYGVISYSVEQRTSEFGIKMALGARPANLLMQVLGQGLALAFIGVGIGVVLALLLAQSLQSFVYGASSSDNLVLVITAILLAACTIAASCVPALRAMRIEPVTALRYE
jgi:ABC-type antimicrobial peptide transport system permease subunit